MAEQLSVIRQAVWFAVISSCIVAATAAALSMWFHRFFRHRTNMTFLIGSLTVILLVGAYLLAGIVMYAGLDRIPHLLAPDFFILDPDSGQVQSGITPSPVARLYPLLSIGIVVTIFVLGSRRRWLKKEA